jgi:ATP-dependent DNA ligase
VRLYSRNAHDWTARPAAIAAAVLSRSRPRASPSTGEGLLGPDGLSRFEELRSREAAHAAILYAFDFIALSDSSALRQRNRGRSAGGDLREVGARCGTIAAP